jgi:flagellar hook-associated protein 3 FlgL
MINGTRFRLDQEIGRQARLAREIARGQIEIATGKRILAPSDDPIGAARVAEINRAQANEATWIRNIDTALALASRSDTVLGSVASNLDRAKELMLSAASGTLSADNRQVIAQELQSIRSELATLRVTLDPRGEPLFRAGTPLEIPVSPGTRLAPVASRDVIFDTPVDIVAALDAAAAAVVLADPAARQAAVNGSLGTLDGALSQVANARADQGTRASRLDDIRDRLAESGLQLEEQKSGLESANISEIVARISAKDLNLKAAQAIFARVNQSSLFDLLR